jgi:two-component system response regulator AtoC
MKEARPSILVVDDESSIRESFSMILSGDYNVSLAASGEAALKKAADEKIDIVFLDIRMPGMDGIETLKKLKNMNSLMEVVMVTAVNDVTQASQAMLLGANNYIVKPFDVDQIVNMTKAILKKKTNKEEFKMAGARTKALFTEEMAGSSIIINKINRLILDLAESTEPVMIVGDNGTEKETAAELIHSKSQRKACPLKIVDISLNQHPEKLYADLFGSSKGSFAGGLFRKTGLFEEASGGSVMINNIQNASPEVQTNIASIISRGQALRQGGATTSTVDVRIFLSSDRSPKTLFENGSLIKELDIFAPDRIINLPPLSQRMSDVPSIINRHKEISQDALQVLLNCPWPGNYAQLNNIIENAAIKISDTPLSLQDLPLDILLNSERSLSYEALGSRFEKAFIFRVLKRTDFDLNSAAQMLGITKNSLSSKIETLEIK